MQIGILCTRRLRYIILILECGDIPNILLRQIPVPLQRDQ